MAIGNYGLIVDTSNFKPFTFDDLVKPFLLYKQDYEKMQDKIEKYDEEFGKLSLPEDSQYYDTLQNFKNQYADVSQRISEGDWARGSAEMRNLFRIARRDIAPIKEATIARNKAVEDMNKMKIQDPSLIYDSDVFKVDNFIGGNVPDIKAVSGQFIEKDAMQAIAAYAAQHPNDPTLTKIQDGFLSYKQGGISNEDAFKKALADLGKEGNNDTTNEYLTILQRVLDKYNISDKDEVKSKILNNVISGAIKGIPPIQQQLQSDTYHMNQYQQASIDLSRREMAMKENEERRKAAIDEFTLNSMGYFRDGNNRYVQNPEQFRIWKEGRKELEASGYLGDEVTINGKVYKKQQVTDSNNPKKSVIRYVDEDGVPYTDHQISTLMLSAANEDVQSNTPGTTAHQGAFINDVNQIAISKEYTSPRLQAAYTSLPEPLYFHTSDITATNKDKKWSTRPDGGKFKKVPNPNAYDATEKLTTSEINKIPKTVAKQLVDALNSKYHIFTTNTTATETTGNANQRLAQIADIYVDHDTFGDSEIAVVFKGQPFFDQVSEESNQHTINKVPADNSKLGG